MNFPEEMSTTAMSVRPDEFTQAVLNILEDFSSEKERLGHSQRAVLNILEDFSAEKTRLEQTQRAVINILDDFVAEKEHLESTQKAILNILDDFESEKNKVDAINTALRTEVGERVAAEHALSEKGLALARSNSELEQFAYVASHDLQEPLRMVSSYVQLLADKYSADIGPEAEKYISYAVEGANRMHGLISGLLEYSRTGRDESLSEVEMKTAFDQALINIQTSVRESGATITTDHLPTVMADVTQLVQLFQNLFSNAIKFARPNVPPKIHVSVRRADRFWEFTVEDNGIGIEPRHCDRIFMIFQRLHSRQDYPGTGIGLSICKKVVERFGGSIRAQSKPNVGSKFIFTVRKS